MKCKSDYSKHITALSALFILGNAVITLPDASADEYCLAAYAASCAVAIAVYFALSYTVMLFSERVNTGKAIFRVLAVTVYLTAALLSLWCLALTFSDFTDFAGKAILSDTPNIFIALLFLFVCFVFSLCTNKSFLKFCLVAFFAALIPMLFFFFAVSDGYTLRNIFVFAFPKPGAFFKQMLPYLKNPMLPSLLLPVYNVLTFDDIKKNASLKGLAVGYALLGGCILSSVLLFGTEYASELDYAYSQSISTAVAGRLFTRLDGFSYFMYFACALVKITVCSRVMLLCLKKASALLNDGQAAYEKRKISAERN